MTKDVLIKISGLQVDAQDEGYDNEPVEIITAASYYEKNGKHYIFYEELEEGTDCVTKNRITLNPDRVEIQKMDINVLVDTAKCLSEVFGNENVYRLGGGEFAAFGFETDESFFDSDVARAGKLISDRKINVAIGGVYCTYGTMNMNGVVKRAREHTTVN